MKTDYCQYPPRIAADVEIVEQRDEAQSTYIAGSTSAARYALLRETEYKVFNLIDQADSVADLCARFERQFGGKLSIATLSKFLAKLDQSGILAGERSQAIAPPAQQPGQAVYLRFKLFDPGNLFARMIPSLRWIWTTEFVAATAALMAAAVVSALVNPDEVADYGITFCESDGWKFSSPDGWS